MPMQPLAMLTKVFRNEPRILRWLSRSSPPNPLDELVSDLKRELYGMDRREESVVRRILASTGQSVTVCRDTIAFDRKGKPCALERGRQVTIPGVPLQVDVNWGVQVVVIDQQNQYLSMRLTDYIRDVCTDH